MSFLIIMVTSIGLAMDAAAVAICLGLNIRQQKTKKAFIIGIYFGVFQALMPLIGYLVAKLFADKIIAFDHWIAFALLLILGIKMILASFEKKGSIQNIKELKNSAIKSTISNEALSLNQDTSLSSVQNMHTNAEQAFELNNKETSLKMSKMLPFAIATSIDALAVGVSFAFLKVKIVLAVSTIGVVTLILSMAGVVIGSIFGTKIKSKAELFGGIILILIGVKILIEHLIAL